MMELSRLQFQLSDDPALPYSSADVYDVISDLVTSGYGYIDYHGTVKKFGIKKVAKMIDSCILYLRPMSDMPAVSKACRGATC